MNHEEHHSGQGKYYKLYVVSNPANGLENSLVAKIYNKCNLSESVNLLKSINKYKKFSKAQAIKN